MLKFGNREFRNLQEQVLKNMENIANLKEGTAVLSEFGIKVVGEVDTLADLPSVIDYKSAHEDWEYGDAFAIGTEPPYTLVILTRANDEITADHWFDIGEFPAPGPQGPAGPQGEVGPQGQTGDTGPAGDDAGFGSVLATAQTLPAGSSATATVTASGPNTAKEFSFTFGIPRGADGGNATWGNIQGTLSDQTDLDNALDAKQDTLVSGTNIKTINSQSIVGSGNLVVDTGTWGNISGTLSDQTDLQNALNAKQPVIDVDHKLSASLVSGLATVATTGAYADLDGKPTIGTGTITIKKNGETIDSFGLNQTADQNINIAVPTKTSDLSNDSNFTNKTYVDDGLALKQDVISDLSTIRSGAAAGATAVQPATLQSELATKQDVISDLATIRSGAEAGATAVQPGDLATVATTGDYDDLLDKPDLSVYAETADLGTAAYIDENALSIAASQVTGLATVATSGAYADLSGKPTKLVTYTGTSQAAGTIEAGQLNVNYTELESVNSHSGWWQDGTSDYQSTLYANGIVIDDLDQEDANAPYYIGLQKKTGTLALISDIPTDLNQLTNTPNYQTANNVTNSINAATSNMVTTDTAQNISAAKTFVKNNSNNYIEIDAQNDNIEFVNGNDTLKQSATGVIYNNYVISYPANRSGTFALKSDIPSSIVNDVTVNGTSVVSSGTAVLPAIPSISANPATTTANLLSITIDGVSYAITGATPSNMVTTDGNNQAITGTKTFSNTITFSGDAVFSGTNHFTGAAPLTRPAANQNFIYTGLKIYPDDANDSSWKLMVNSTGTEEDEFAIYLPNKNGTLATTSDIPTIPVTDVTVGGTSVVSSGTAAIPAILGTSTETWTFTLADGTTTTKTIVLG